VTARYDPAVYEIIWPTGACRITGAQNHLLLTLIYAQGKPVTWSALSAALWPDPGFDRLPRKPRTALETQASKLRRRLLLAKAPVRIVTVYRFGLRLLDEVDIIL
jgi:DNA-binding winged helix-turn-helix (wHTH) protein